GRTLASGQSGSLTDLRHNSVEENVRPQLHIEPEVHDVAVLDDIVFAFLARLSRFLGAGLAAVFHIVVIGDGLGLDETLLEIAMYDAGRLRRCCAPADGPGAGFLGANGKVGNQPQQIVACSDDTVEARLFKAKTIEKVLLLVV